MSYFKDYYNLQEHFKSMDGKSYIEDFEILEIEFHSNSHTILPGKKDYYCALHDLKMNSDGCYFNDIGTLEGDVHIKDINVEENRNFKFHILKKKSQKKIDKGIFMLHGFNEKDWDKYLPWAKSLSQGTGSSIILFPIAFHMQRAPEFWSSKREMFKISSLRKKRFPNIIHSTLSNVAICMRLQTMPQRFIWSGLQTYYDVIQFIEDCKNDTIECIDKNFHFDVFAYSIGGFLSQILKLANHRNYFQDSKVCLFCSGATFNRFTPVSKFILDSEANAALYSFLVEHFEVMLEKDPLLNHYIQDHFEGKVFHAMLDYEKMRTFREDLLRKYASQFYAISPLKDHVIPSFEVINTLKGAYRDIQIKVDEMDFPFDYTHENPFPQNEAEKELIENGYKQVFDKFCDFLNREI